MNVLRLTNNYLLPTKLLTSETSINSIVSISSEPFPVSHYFSRKNTERKGDLMCEGFPSLVARIKKKHRGTRCFFSTDRIPSMYNLIKGLIFLDQEQLLLCLGMYKNFSVNLNDFWFTRIFRSFMRRYFPNQSTSTIMGESVE